MAGDKARGMGRGQEAMVGLRIFLKCNGKPSTKGPRNSNGGMTSQEPWKYIY